MPKSKIDESLYEMRSVLMRLYHSYWQGEEFYPARFVNGCAPAMESSGLIDKYGDGWRITDAGIDEWAEMNRHALMLQPNQRSYLSGSQFFFLRDRLMKGSSDMETPVCKVEGCGNPCMVSKNGEAFPKCVDHQRAEWREVAKRKRDKRNGKSPLDTETVISHVVSRVDSTAEPLPMDEQEITQVGHTCEICYAKGVIEALRAKSPKLAALIDAMEAQERAAHELGL